jgi:hypothetical protein
LQGQQSACETLRGIQEFPRLRGSARKTAEGPQSPKPKRRKKAFIDFFLLFGFHCSALGASNDRPRLGQADADDGAGRDGGGAGPQAAPAGAAELLAVNRDTDEDDLG